MIGRVSFIELAPWSKRDLEQIGRKGFDLLGMEISDEALDMLASESALSPQLMQENCFNLAFAMITEDRAITIEDVRAAFRDTVTEYKHYQEVVARILEGPSKGRSRRKVYGMEKQKIALFVDGDFWHARGHQDNPGEQVRSNREYWQKHLGRNVERDKEVNDALTEAGWLVLRFWESEIRRDLGRCLEQIAGYI